jgi:surface carbohydrate biosynthesis protein
MLDKDIRIALPVETKVRELNGKLWLAAHLAGRGYRVALGELSCVKKNLPLLKPHIYIGDSAVHKKSRIELYSQLKQANIVVAVHDTEGGIIYSRDYYKGRLSLEVLKSVGCFLAWGEETADIFKEVWTDKGIVLAAVGNPVFDLLSTSYRQFYQKEKEILSRRFGKFVLINTHFGFYNHYNRELYVEPLREKFPGLFEFKKKLFLAFVEAIQKLCKANKKVNFVIRPHPSENFERYKEIFSDFPNVFVEHDLSVHPWALAASLVLHNGCTTGVEAALLGRPVVSYRPVTDADWDVYLPNFVSQQADNVNELQNSIDRYCTSEADIGVELDAKQKDVLERILYFQDGRSAERICDTFELLQLSDDIRIDKLQQKSLFIQLKRLLQDCRRSLMFCRSSEPDNGYAEQKFSRISLEELTVLLELFKNINPELANVTITEVGDIENLFWVSSESLSV